MPGFSDTVYFGVMMDITDIKVTVTHRLDPEQFSTLMHYLIEIGISDPAKVAALTDKLKTSADALKAAVIANQPPQQH